MLRSLNRMHEVIPGRARRGQGRRRRPVALRPQRRPGRRTPPDRHGLPAAQPVPDDVDLRQRARGQPAERQEAEEVRRRRRSSSGRCSGANLWNEVKDRLNKPGMGLSGGQQQRLCIARAIAVKPEVLLMDEPCSALDPISTSAIEDLIHELKSDYTIVIVTHNMQQAARVCDDTASSTSRPPGSPATWWSSTRPGRCSPPPTRPPPRPTSPAASADLGLLSRGSP